MAKTNTQIIEAVCKRYGYKTPVEPTRTCSMIFLGKCLDALRADLAAKPATTRKPARGAAPAGRKGTR